MWVLCGGDNTKDCCNQEVQQKKKCANCTGSHASWERGRCPVWREKVQKREQLRAQLLCEQAEHFQGVSRPPQNVLEANEVAGALQSKRRRQNTLGEPASQQATQQQSQQERRQVGKPRWNEGQASATQPMISAVLRARDQGPKGAGEQCERDEMDTA